MLFFDFLYYLIYKFYSGYREKGAEATSVSIVAGLQTLNVLTIILLIQSFDNQKVYINKMMLLVVFLIFEIYNYRRYLYQENHSAKVIESKWVKKTESSKRHESIFLFLYGAISIISSFGLAIYFGVKK